MASQPRTPTPMNVRSACIFQGKHQRHYNSKSTESLMMHTVKHNCAKEQEVKYFVGSLHHHHHHYLAVKQAVALEREQIIWVARRNSF
jgi:hypothetical protein